MFLKKHNWLLLSAILSLTMTGNVLAEEATSTVVVLTRLCSHCSKKITVKLKELPGVEAVESDIEHKTVTVVPKPRAVLSPRSIWETIEKAGEKPVKLEGPNGTFESKPEV